MQFSQARTIRNAVEPFGARVDAGDVAIERREAFDDGTRNVASAEHHNSPVAVVVRFKEQLYRAAARHANVALEIPFDEFGQRRLIGGLGEHRTSVVNRLQLYAAAADS